MNTRDGRPDPDALLKRINSDVKNEFSGKLRIFLGMSAGVGKTYAMLKAAHQKKTEGVDIVIGVVETHGRSDTAALTEGLELIPKKKILYKGTQLEEMDLDAVLRRKPKLVIVDELAHTNASGSRHAKRYQDVLELLESGIDVYTSLNVQHLESRKDSVEQITGIMIRETVPDSILEKANLVELVDIAPSELLKRLKEGKVYLGEKAESAAANFFKEDKLTALREIALRMTAERVDQDLQKFSVSRDASPWQTNERLLVAISHSPYSERIIRATRRLAYNLEAPWIALHVNTGLTLSDADQAQLQKNISLAQELNAEVITTTDADVATAIKRVSRQKNVTQVIVGRPTRRWFRDVIEGGSLLERLVKESQEVDVHVIRHEKNKNYKPSFFDEILLYRTRSGWIKYYYAFWFVVVVTIFGAMLESYIGYRAVGFVFFLGVIISGMFGSIGAVVFSATLSALVWNFGFIPPRFTFVISSPDDIILCVSFFVVAIITGFLTNRIRVRENLIREREERTNVMNLILQDISGSQNKREFIKKIADRISSLLYGKTAIILKSKEGQLNFDKSDINDMSIAEKEQAVALWSFQNNKAAGWSTETLGQESCLYVPLCGVGESVGVLVFKPTLSQTKMNPEQMGLLLSITTQLGISIERHFLSRRLADAQRLKDSEVLHQTLLNSISHEMRTPLTAIMGAASALEKHAVEDKDVKEISAGLSDAGDRLNRVIENLLDMSRLNSGVLGLKLEWQDLSDLVGVVLKKLEKNLRANQVQTRISDEIGLVEIDFRLFEHALSNIILNSIQYAGANCSIQIECARKANSIVITISDDGRGIPDESVPHLFEKFYRVPGTPAGGTGLGLSIVQAIVELHKGTIRFEANKPQGSKFIIELPYRSAPTIPKETLT
ncbi:MAG: ATP-binding protein [Pseudobdellovibrio sp.]